MSKNWHYAKNGQKHGPISATELKQLAASGGLSPGDLVWREDMKEWRKASSVKGLFPEKVSATRTPPPPPRQVKNSAEEIPAWERPAILALLVICCFPVGLFLLWRNPRVSTQQKAIWSGVVGGLMILGFFASLFEESPTSGNRPSKDVVDSASQNSPRRALNTDSATPQILHEPYTHVRMPKFDESRTQELTQEEFLKHFKSQPYGHDQVKDVSAVSFAEGRHGEQIELYVVRGPDDSVEMEGCFYREKDSGEPIFHGPARRYFPNGRLGGDYLFIWGNSKCVSEWNSDGRPVRLELYDGDERHRVYSVYYYKTDELHPKREISRFETHRHIHYEGADGKEKMRFAQDGLKVEYDESGEVWRETIWGNTSPTNQPSASRVFGTRFRTGMGETKVQGVMEAVDPRDRPILQHCLREIRSANSKP